MVVPLDRSGALPGTISLEVEQRSAEAGRRSTSAVVALAGGPGQAALGLGEFIATAIAPALSTRDLLVFDQRGTGASDPLHCGALEDLSGGSVGALLERCAGELGPARGSFTTQESVADIEAIRAATGYEKLVLYGTSYGTKVALEYAERYPQHVEALVLDSVVPAGGPEPFEIPSLQAIGPALAELCAQRACAGITSNPLRDLTRLAARLRTHALSGSVYDGSGNRHAATLNEPGLLAILEAGDLNPALRALLPAAVQSALRRDPAPLLRLHLLSEGLIPSVPRGRVEGPITEAGQSIDEALFVTTSCEETPFPWQRAASSSTRLAEALAALHAKPASDFLPFDATTAFDTSLIGDCASWPDASPPPPAPGPLPDVPTLILSGAQDLRTPTANALAVAAQIPGAQVLVVPFTGHSVLGSDFSGCAERGVGAFFTGEPVPPCADVENLFPPTPITPPSLSSVHPPPALGGNPGRTLAVVLDTILDLDRQVVGATLQADQELPRGSSFGGLHGGYARLDASALELVNLAFVPGVKLSGSFPIRDGELQTATIRVSGSQASRGEVRIGTGTTISGTLGGRHFDVSVARAEAARAGAQAWPSRPLRFPLAGLVEAGAALR
ncbi:MAG TPA: alpha/beta fold hydrolase [Solirubrobacteraceae bacterium]|nr:alpha/beta fold hydrolase [Solirubrobacteraceae bacterium]